MTTVSDVKSKPVDAAKVLRELADFWADPQPARFTHRVPERIAGSKHDQQIPKGVQNPYWEIVRQMPLETITASWGCGRPEPDQFFFTPGDPMRLLADRRSLCATY